MNIKELKELVDKWVEEKGFEIQCEACGQNIRIKPYDVMVSCSLCESSYHVAPFILEEVKNLMWKRSWS